MNQKDNSFDRQGSMDALFCTVGKNKNAKFYLFPELCKGCGLCIVKCPVHTLVWSHHLGIYGTPVVEPEDDGLKCTACGLCQLFCPDCAIKIEKL